MDAIVLRRSTVPAAGLRLSVVVPCYSLGALCVEAVRSVLHQTMSALEVIVVDDGSTDDTLQCVLAIDDPRLTCITQHNRGLAAARNTGVRHARAAFIGFCDGDDVWHPDKAARHLALMELDASIGLTFSYSAYLDESGAPTGQLLVTRCGQPTAYDLVVRNHVGNGSTPIVRRECFERAGLFDETLRSCEDVEMWVRLSVLTPFTLRLIPEPLTGYRVRPGSLTVSFDNFLAASRLAVQRFQQYLPGVTPRIAERSYAETLRIASRKALSNGQVTLSRSLFLQALHYAPDLVVRDARALGMGILHLLALVLPPRVQTVPYRLLRRLMKFAYARICPSSGFGQPPWRGARKPSANKGDAWNPSRNAEERALGEVAPPRRS
jgi:glycosyltransferase involved in cell wall biosynthesis